MVKEYLRLFGSWFGSASGLLALLWAFSTTIHAENLEHNEIPNIQKQRSQKENLLPQQIDSLHTTQNTLSNQTDISFNPQEWTNVEHEDILTIQGGGMWLQDQYLSPLLYDGVSVGITNEWWQAFHGKKREYKNNTSDRSTLSYDNTSDTIFLSCGTISDRRTLLCDTISDRSTLGGKKRLSLDAGESNGKRYIGCWEHVGKVGIQVSGLENEPQSNKIYAIGVNAGWGAYYTWKWKITSRKTNISRFQIGVGPYVAGDFMPRYIVNNVNKPYSMDIAAEIDAMAFVSYSFGGKKTSYRLRYLIRTNLIGIDFMPDYWQSYYEITEGIAGKTRCAGMWNHRYLNHELTLDMQFKHSTWRIGVRHEYLEYGEKSMWFSREQVSAVIGTCFRYRTKGNHRLTE